MASLSDGTAATIKVQVGRFASPVMACTSAILFGVLLLQLEAKNKVTTDLDGVVGDTKEDTCIVFYPDYHPTTATGISMQSYLKNMVPDHPEFVYGTSITIIVVSSLCLVTYYVAAMIRKSESDNRRLTTTSKYPKWTMIFTTFGLVFAIIGLGMVCAVITRTMSCYTRINLATTPYVGPYEHEELMSALAITAAVLLVGPLLFVGSVLMGPTETQEPSDANINHPVTYYLHMAAVVIQLVAAAWLVGRHEHVHENSPGNCVEHWTISENTSNGMIAVIAATSLSIVMNVINVRYIFMGKTQPPALLNYLQHAEGIIMFAITTAAVILLFIDGFYNDAVFCHVSDLKEFHKESTLEFHLRITFVSAVIIQSFLHWMVDVIRHCAKDWPSLKEFL